MKERPQADSLSKALSLLPYLLSKKEVPVAKAAEDLGIDQSQIRRIVQLLQFCGLPPYGGGDTFDCFVEKGHIYMMPGRGGPTRPARLTFEEATSLAVAVEMIGDLTPSLRSAATAIKKKLQAAISRASAMDEFTMPVEVRHVSSVESEILETLRTAVAECRLIKMAYFSVNSNELTQRLVEPQGLYYSKGNWYLSGFCRRRRASLVFRVDRVRDVELTGEVIAERRLRAVAERKSPEYVPEGESLIVEMSLPRQEAERLQERASSFLKDVQYEGEIGHLQVMTQSMKWVTRFVLQYGGQAYVKGPPKARTAVRAQAEKILSKYLNSPRVRSEGAGRES